MCLVPVSVNMSAWGVLDTVVHHALGRMRDTKLLWVLTRGNKFLGNNEKDSVHQCDNSKQSYNPWSSAFIMHFRTTNSFLPQFVSLTRPWSVHNVIQLFEFVGMVHMPLTCQRCTYFGPRPWTVLHTSRPVLKSILSYYSILYNLFWSFLLVRI